MTDKDFFRLVIAMRSAQRRHFADRTSIKLDVARQLEPEVDQAIKARLDPQPTLFDRKPD